MNIDTSPLAISASMMQSMIAFVDQYQQATHRNPYTIPIDSDSHDFISYNKYMEMLEYYLDYNYPTTIPINKPKQ